MGEIGQVAPMQADGHCGSRSGAQVVPRKGAADFVAPSRTSIKVREHIGRLDDERNSARLPDPAPSMQAPARGPAEYSARPESRVPLPCLSPRLCTLVLVVVGIGA